jgi:sulfur relay protein TusB/DsrH
MSKLIPNEDSASILMLTRKLAEKRKDIALLHIKEACRATTSAEYCSKLREASIKVYALRADVEARKLTKKMHPGVELIDYKQWVSLLMDKRGKVVSWTG